ncbi:WYL domain-containing protein [Pseudobutyrivibrio ruminis]|jgi:predicted DNA-binding transcriptional regulator YafY|uniref:WYL domain-containing protein n=1 Tax=Pseudobutyrivibrio ruminis TaxID=46206 RepID=A0A2G3EAV6_9FIRM|nr:WYL domain-containing protein [Pseudobutyrivibrio ruminis]PHU40201.1 WYL domain-containing protein [Pseudobutyrivibrio ruminis]
MAKGSNQKLKLSYLCKIMQEKTDDDHSLTLSQIMEALDGYGVTAERKSLYDDFAVMTDKLGIEIIKTQKGRETYYHVGERQFELAEVKLLIDAIQSSKFITENKSKVLIAKIKSLVSEHQGKQLQRQVYINSRIKNMNESIYYNVDAIHTAIFNNKQIEFKYCEWTIDKTLIPKKSGATYVVSPWALTWANDYYYLIAYDSMYGKMKHYRVDKMKEVSGKDVFREGKDLYAKINMEDYALENFSMYGGEIRRVHIEFPNNKVGIFIDRFGKDINIGRVDDIRSFIVVDVAISNQFFGWIFSLGSDVKVTKPRDIIKKMHDEGEKFLINYYTNL